YINCIDRGVSEFLRQGDSHAAGPRPYVGHNRNLPMPRNSQNLSDERLRFRPGYQHCGSHDKLQSAKLLSAQDVLEGLQLGSTAQKRKNPFPLIVLYDSGAIDVQAQWFDSQSGSDNP